MESLTKRNKLTTGGVWVDHASAAHAWDRKGLKITVDAVLPFVKGGVEKVGLKTSSKTWETHQKNVV